VRSELLIYVAVWNYCKRNQGKGLPLNHSFQPALQDHSELRSHRGTGHASFGYHSSHIESAVGCSNLQLRFACSYH
jgi:hypothetical protein